MYIGFNYMRNLSWVEGNIKEIYLVLIIFKRLLNTLNFV